MIELEQKKFAEERRAKPGATATASELEVLQVFKEAEETEKPLNVSDYTGMSPGYVSMLISCLVKKGFLAPTGARQYRLTKEAKELLEKKSVGSENNEASETFEDKSEEVLTEEKSPMEMRKDEGLDWRPLNLQS